jgi:L-lactate dehydrogenase complex protein LldE
MPEESRSEDLGHRVREFSDFLVNVMGVKNLGARCEGKAVFHCGCHQRGNSGF